MDLAKVLPEISNIIPSGRLYNGDKVVTVEDYLSYITIQSTENDNVEPVGLVDNIADSFE